MFALVVQSGTVRTILYGCTISSSSPAAAAKSPQVAGNESLTDLLSYSAPLDDLFSNSTGALKSQPPVQHTLQFTACRAQREGKKLGETGDIFFFLRD